MSSRFGYTGEDDGVPPGLWKGCVNSAIRGKRGQAALRELEAALLAMPEHRLCRGDVATYDGGVCAVGALKVHRDMQRFNQTWAEAQANLAERPPEGAWETAELGLSLGLVWTLAWELGAVNDDQLIVETDEARWQAMLDWVRARLRTEAPA